MGERLSVLVVDDEADIRETLKLFLESLEIFTFIVEAEDGSDAWMKIQNQNFDLVITDLMMPKVRGLELVNNIKGLDAKKEASGQKPISIVILSANLTGLEVKKAIAFGVKHALTKPCTSDAFLEKIESILRTDLKHKLIFD